MSSTVAASSTLAESRRTRLRQLTLLMAIAVPVSIVHYIDNVANYSAYPESETLPNATSSMIALAWFVFTAAGMAGYLRYRSRRDRAALLLLAFYSGSGLIGLLHYAVPGAIDMVWWRQLHIAVDVLSGGAIFAFVLREARGG